MNEICDDLAEEHAALDEIVADLSEEQWRTPTPAAGWDVHDTIGHLHAGDLLALRAVTDPDGFERWKTRLRSGEARRDSSPTSDATTGSDLLARWRNDRRTMVGAFRPLRPKDRIPWVGPSMSALSFATARLMETWAHGHDIATALGRTLPATARLRHVCHIGVTTRGWSYANRGQAVPDDELRVELTPPAGGLWTWGPEDATARVRGSAVEFCLVATQRRRLEDTSLLVDGATALAWLQQAQAFAGPATSTDPARQHLPIP